MILLTLTTAQATHIAQHVTDPDLLDAICQQLRMETVCPTDDADGPQLVMFKAVDGRVSLAAISYFDEQAAIRAEEKFWQRVQAEAVAPGRRKKSA